MRLTLVVAVAAVLVLSQTAPTRGAVFVVDSTADAVDAAPGNGVCDTGGAACTLRAAVQESNALAGSDTITLPAGTYTLTVSGDGEDSAATGDIDLQPPSFDNLTIAGAGAATTIVDGNGTDRVFDVCPSGFNCVPNDMQVRDLTIRNGAPPSDTGGGLRNRARLTLTRVVITDNDSVFCGGGIGNVDTGMLTVVDSAISGNTVTGNGGGLCNRFGAMAHLTGSTISANQAFGFATTGGGVFGSQSSEVTLTNCTVSGNSADGGGGGIMNYGGSGFTRTILNNVTVTDNTAGALGGSPAGGGIANAFGFAVVQLRNSIVAGNTDLTATAPDCGGTFDSQGYNLIQSLTGCAFSFPNATDLTGGTADLGPLLNNGGPTDTHAPLASSAAIDGGNPLGCDEWLYGSIAGPIADDQRAVPRPQGAACDIGAVETVECADGTTGPGEQCDDGNLAAGDCCDPTCQFEPAASPCSDLNACTDADACDGAGTCIIGPPLDCDDLDPCTRDSCIPASGCDNVLPTGCLAAGKSLLLVKNNADDGKDQIAWKWLKGAETDLADFGDPQNSTDYTLCVHSGPATARVGVPAGANWQPSGSTGLKYKEPSGTGAPSGAQKAGLKSGAAGKSKVQVKGKGADLPDSLVPMLTLPVTVQLVNDDNAVCFEATYTSGDVLKNDSKQFKAKR